MSDIKVESNGKVHSPTVVNLPNTITKKIGEKFTQQEEITCKTVIIDSDSVRIPIDKLIVQNRLRIFDLYLCILIARVYFH